MNRRVSLTVLVAGFVAATSPVWAAGAENPTFIPNPADAGQTVAFSGSAPTSKGSTSCGVTATPTPTYSCTDNGGRFSGWVVVPTAVTPGTSYVLTFCGPAVCDPKRAWTATSSIEIASPPAQAGVTVPSLHCADYPSAAGQLSRATLRPGGTRFPGEVGSEEPSAGSRVSPGSTVTLYPMRVPSLEGISYAAAVRRIAAACATPVRFGPPDGLVTSQLPVADAIMPTDRLVTVYLAPMATTIPPTTIPPTTSSPASTSTSFSTTSTGPTSSRASRTTATTSDFDHRPGPSRRAWWRRAALPTGSLVGLAALALVGLHEWRIHRPPTPMALGAELRFRNPRDPSDWASTRPGRVTPSFVLRLHTSYQWREPS